MIQTWCRNNSDQDEKACFSRVGKTHPYDYSVAFSDMQTLQRLQRKFFRSMVMLESSISIVKGCNLHCLELEDRGLFSPRTMYQELESISLNLSYHVKVVASMIKYSKGTAKLVRPTFSV